MGIPAIKRAQRLSRLHAYPFARWSERLKAAQQRGLDVIRLDIGNPDLPPPGDVVEALCRAAHYPDQHGYQAYRGIDALRQGVSEYYEGRFGVALDAATEVLPLIGSKEGIVHLAQACLDPGDLALVPDPGYAAYGSGARLAGADVHLVPLIPRLGFLPDLDAIPSDSAERASLLWLNYPNNPTGATASLEFLAKAVGYARRHRLLLCHDAAYCDVTFDGYTAPSVLQVPGAMDVAVEFSSLSKSFNMAGWRLGVLAGNADVVASVAQVKSNVDSGMFRPLQVAALRALQTDHDWLEQRNDVYARRREILLDGLAAAGMAAARTSASLYIWTSVPAGTTSEAFALALLREQGVAVAPGTFFGPGGEGYVRFSVTARADRISQAMERLGRKRNVATGRGTGT